MKIVKLTAENVKKLKAVEITPEGEIVMLTGKNEQGKSSVLDSIWYALGGKDATKNTPEPIRKGQKKASATVDLGEIVVTRNWTGSDSYLKVTGSNGEKVKGPQALLDSLVGQLTFDPLEFLRMDPKKQIETLQQMGDMEVDPREIEEEKQKLYEERTMVNREAKRLQGQLSGLQPPDKDTPEEEQSSANLLKMIQDVQDRRQANHDKRYQLEQKRTQAAILKKEIDELKERLATREAAFDQIAGEGRALKMEVDVLVDPDIEPLQEKLSTLEEVNQKVREAKKYRETKDMLEEVKRDSDNLTAKMETLEEQKQEAIRNATFPVEGLAFDEQGIVYKELPLSQASDGAKLRISLSMGMALNPELRVILIRDGSLLDSSNMQIIADMAKEHDFQVWIEKVDETGEVGVYIEEGEVKAIN